MTARFICALLAPAFLTVSCDQQEREGYAGYVEAELLFMSAEEGGAVSEVFFAEGDIAEAGAVLFRLEETRAWRALEQSEAAARAARLRAEDAGALDQAVIEATAAHDRAKKSYDRTRALAETQVATRARLDDERAALETATARLARARAEREAGAADLAAAEAAAAAARKRLEDRTVRAPEAGRVERVYRRAGEVAAAGEPVLALLPPGRVKVRFFAPQSALGGLRPGDAATVLVDGREAPVAARITFIAAEPQFTPPVIYSLDEREKLVFLVEARPDAPEGLVPGLPVTVQLP